MENIKGTGGSEADMLAFAIRRNVTLLFKQQLELLEDLADEHDNAMHKLSEKLPKQYADYIELADYLNEQKFEMLRKRILGKGNDCIRAIEESLKDFDITIKKE